MFALVVRFDLHPGQATAFDELMSETLPAIRAAEPGTLLYVCCRIEDAPDARLFMEIYAGRDAFAEHQRTPATMRFMQARTSMIAATRVEYLAPYQYKLTEAPA